MRIVVIGGTGRIGSKLAARLREGGHEVTAAAPETGVNTLTGEGLAEALAGASVVVDVANAPSFDERDVLDFFQTSTSHLLAAAAAAGVGHHVTLSIVGIERLPHNGYFRAKIAQEHLIKASKNPHSIVRSTQFFEFVSGIADMATEGVTVRLAPVLFQPIAADDVARALSQIAVGAPLNDTVEIAGPEQFPLDEVVRRSLRASNDPRQVVADPQAHYFGDVPGERTLVPGTGALLFETRFDEWLRRPALTGAS